VDWQTANRYAASLAKLVRNSSVSEEILAQDRERLKHTKRVGPIALRKSEDRVRKE
jgi:hypothetical protein